MNAEDHVWELATKKLAGEASEEELRELDFLLIENPELKTSLMLIVNWWQDEQPNADANSYLLFEQVLKKIKPEEEVVEQNTLKLQLLTPEYKETKKARK